MRLLARLLPVLFCFQLTAQLTGAPTASAFDPKPWLEDFHQILSEMSAHYANLEWGIEARRMDLPRLKQETEGDLRTAGDEAAARKAIDKFIAAFGDGHLAVHWPKPAGARATSNATGGICDHLDYVNRVRPGLDFSALPDFSPADNPEAKLFPGGILRLRNGAVLGVLRIGLFSEHSFPELCEQAAKELRLTDNSPCDEKCEDGLELATANLLTGALSRQASFLRAAGAQAILVDITNNGGGSDWVEPAARVLSPVPLRDARMAFIKHEHWTRQLEDHLREVQADRKNQAASPISLSDAETKFERGIEESKQACNRNSVWDSGKLDCSLLVGDLFFTSGQILDYAKPGSLEGLASKEALFYPSLYRYEENPQCLPLVVVADRNTWSAAEYFAAMLQDNHAAAVIGEVTGGAGCGYTNGGIPAKLKNSGAELEMPDCVRYRADGSNEVNGVIPERFVPWAQHDSSFQRVQKLRVFLESKMAQSPAK